MKTFRGLIVVMLSAVAVLTLLAVLQPREPAQARSNAAGDHVIISEVLYDPTGTDNGLEWVELYNPTTGTIDLNNYSLGNGGSDYTVSRVQLSGTLTPSSCWVIGGPTSNITNYLPILDQPINFNPDFQNASPPPDADGIALFDVKAISITSVTIPIDAVIYGSVNTNNLIDETGTVNPPDSGVAASGKSNERIDAAWQCSDQRRARRWLCDRANR
jgi:hypothetical protein